MVYHAGLRARAGFPEPHRLGTVYLSRGVAAGWLSKHELRPLNLIRLILAEERFFTSIEKFFRLAAERIFFAEPDEFRLTAQGTGFSARKSKHTEGERSNENHNKEVCLAAERHHYDQDSGGAVRAHLPGAFYLGMGLQAALTPFGLAPFNFEIVYGVWFMAATVAAFIMQKAGVAFVTEVLAAFLETLMGNFPFITTGLVQGSRPRAWLCGVPLPAL